MNLYKYYGINSIQWKHYHVLMLKIKFGSQERTDTQIRHQII
jgi:hypothetical protein